MSAPSLFAPPSPLPAAGLAPGRDRTAGAAPGRGGHWAAVAAASQAPVTLAALFFLATARFDAFLLVLGGAVLAGLAGLALHRRRMAARPRAESAFAAELFGDGVVPISAAPSLGGQALCDPITGALSRHGLCAAALAARTRPGVLVAIDVARMRDFNASEGTPAGDRLLRDLGARLAARLRPSDLIARWGGDEFVICLGGTGRADAEAVVARLTASLAAEPLALLASAPVSVVTGIAVLEATGRIALETAVREAEEDIYTRKQSGHRRVA